MSPQREFSWILPSVALYFHPQVDFYQVCSERIFIDFSLSGLCIFIPSGYRVSLEITFTGFTLSGFHFTLNPQ